MSNEPGGLKVEGLHKRFGKQEVLRGVDLTVPSGSIFGFLGINGAGKTTLIRILLGLIRADSGRCSVAGVDPHDDALEVRRRVGYMAENQTMYGWMTVGRLIDWVSRFHPDWDGRFADHLCRKMKLDVGKKVGALSKGQTSKLALLLALAHHPSMVILDDPTLGLDPIARRDFLRDVIGYLQEEGVTVFFSSHLLYEIEPICDHVAILHEGRIIKSTPVDDLRESVKQVLVRPGQNVDVTTVPGVLDVQPEESMLSLVVEDIGTAREALSSVDSEALSVVDLNLDEIFEAYVVGRREVVHV